MAVGHPTNGYIILGVLLSHAPDRDAQAFMSKKYNEICGLVSTDHEVEKVMTGEIEKVMAGLLFDGLAFGNWPWTMQYKPTTVYYNQEIAKPVGYLFGDES